MTGGIPQALPASTSEAQIRSDTWREDRGLAGLQTADALHAVADALVGTRTGNSLAVASFDVTGKVHEGETLAAASWGFG